VAEAELAEPAEFLDRLRRGDRRAFESLVTMHQHRVYGLALRMLGSPSEAQDAAQEVFIRAFRSIADFRGDARLSTWLYAITSRVCLSRLGSGGRRRMHEGEEVLARLPDGAPPPGETIERSELEAALRRAIGELPEDRRIVVLLRDIEGLAYEEIARALALPVGTVRSRLHRARLDLRDKLEAFLP
jgi:RNA polymerase sigma-70 factor (ECF subfamily)